MHKEHHPESNLALSDSRNEGGRGLMGCERTIRSEENNFEWCLKTPNENLLQEVKHVRILKFREFLKERISEFIE